jgi:hypothetical protein
VRRSRVGPSYNRESLYGLADLVWRALYFHRCSTPWNRRISARNQGELQNRSNQNSRSFAVKIRRCAYIGRVNSAFQSSIVDNAVNARNQGELQTRSNQGHTRSKSVKIGQNRPNQGHSHSNSVKSRSYTVKILHRERELCFSVIDSR